MSPEKAARWRPSGDHRDEQAFRAGHLLEAARLEIQELIAEALGCYARVPPSGDQLRPQS
jgi:hypothetical protein